MKIMFYNLYQIIPAIALWTPYFCKSVAQSRGKLQTSRVTEQLKTHYIILPKDQLTTAM